MLSTLLKLLTRTRTTPTKTSLRNRIRLKLSVMRARQCSTRSPISARLFRISLQARTRTAPPITLRILPLQKRSVQRPKKSTPPTRTTLSFFCRTALQSSATRLPKSLTISAKKRRKGNRQAREPRKKSRRRKSFQRVCSSSLRQF